MCLCSLQLNGKGGDGGALPTRIKGEKERKESAAERCERRSLGESSDLIPRR